MSKRESLVRKSQSFNQSTEHLAGNSILISGGCTDLKEKAVHAFNNCPEKRVIINLDGNNQYLRQFRCNYVYEIDDHSHFDIFNDLSFRNATKLLKDKGKGFGYSHSEISTLLKYLTFIDKINRRLGLNIDTVSEINRHFYDPDVLKDCIEEMIEYNELNKREADVLEAAFFRSIGGQLLLENLLAELDFDINYNENSFSLNRLRNYEAVLLDFSSRHINSDTDTTAMTSILYDLECCKTPVSVLVNLGLCEFSEIGYNLKSLLIRQNVKLLVIADDIFAQTQTGDTHSFLKNFDYCCFGSHIGQSATQMSELVFPMVTKIEYHKTTTYNRRIFAERLTDRMFDKDKMEAIAQVPVQRRVMEAREINYLPTNYFVLVDNEHNSRYSLQDSTRGNICIFQM